MSLIVPGQHQITLIDRGIIPVLSRHGFFKQMGPDCHMSLLTERAFRTANSVRTCNRTVVRFGKWGALKWMLTWSAPHLQLGSETRVLT
jgi:hypothetical protein